MSSIQLENAINEVCEKLDIDECCIDKIAKIATLEDLVGTDMFQHMPELAKAGFFKYQKRSISLQDILTIITAEENHIRYNGFSQGPYKTLIWWLRELKRNNIVFLNDNNVRQDGSHPFDIAVKIGDLQILRIIARYCPIVDETYAQGKISTSFHPRFGNSNHNLFAYWIARGHSIKAAPFFKWGYSVNDTNSTGMPVLLIAANAGSDDTIKELLNQGANIDAIYGMTGQYALHLYAYNGSDKDLLSLIISKFTDAINHRDNLGQTPLFYASNNKLTYKQPHYQQREEQRLSYVFCKILIDSGAGIDIMNNTGYTVKDVVQSLPHSYNGLASLLDMNLDPIHIDSNDDIYDSNGHLRTGITPERENAYLKMCEYEKQIEVADTMMPVTDRIKYLFNGGFLSEEVGKWLYEVFKKHLSQDLESVVIEPLLQGGITIAWFVRNETITLNVDTSATTGILKIENSTTDEKIDEENLLSIFERIRNNVKGEQK